MSRAWAPVVVAVLALATGCGGGEPKPVAEPPPERQVLLVSGRDDHGLLAEAVVGLVQEPDGQPTAWVPDGTLVTVVQTSGEWARVRTLEGEAAEGWVNDFYLRGTAHLACTNEPVELVAVAGGRVQVRPTDGSPPRWVPRDTVGELPGDPC